MYFNSTNFLKRIDFGIIVERTTNLARQSTLQNKGNKNQLKPARLTTEAPH